MQVNRGAEGGNLGETDGDRWAHDQWQRHCDTSAEGLPTVCPLPGRRLYPFAQGVGAECDIISERVRHAYGLTTVCQEVFVMVDDVLSPAFIIVSANDIAERAYEIYADRGYADGFDREDWLRAERELKTPRPMSPGEFLRKSSKRQ